MSLPNKNEWFKTIFYNFLMDYIMKVLSKSILGLALVSITSAASATVVVNQSISEAEIVGVQKTWCQALVDINSTYDKDGQPAAKALTVAPQKFRTTLDGMLAYFVGSDPTYPQDKGFALKGWTKCESQNAGVFITGNSATSRTM